MDKTMVCCCFLTHSVAMYTDDSLTVCPYVPSFRNIIAVMIN